MDAANLSRRQAALLVTGAMIGSALARPTALLAQDAVALPTGEWRLGRRLSRGLRDGNAITVDRSWQIEFSRQSRGIAIAGRQLAVVVEAPENLAALAKIERERSTQGLFPILLAPDGIIIAAGQNTAQESFDAAVEAAMKLLDEEPSTGEPASPHAEYLAKLQLAGTSLLDQLPGDLFYPSTKPFRDARRIALPDGGAGEFEVSWTANVHSGSALLKKARREVVTRIGASERRSSEDWSLERV